MQRKWSPLKLNSTTAEIFPGLSDQNSRFGGKVKYYSSTIKGVLSACIRKTTSAQKLIEKTFFWWSFILFSFLRRVVACLLQQHSPNSQTLPPSMGLLRVRTNHIKVDTNFHSSQQKEETKQPCFLKLERVF